MKVLRYSLVEDEITILEMARLCTRCYLAQMIFAQASKGGAMLEHLLWDNLSNDLSGSPSKGPLIFHY
jgi:hypothetical protein